MGTGSLLISSWAFGLKGGYGRTDSLRTEVVNPPSTTSLFQHWWFGARRSRTGSLTWLLPFRSL